ncbi:MAG: hypothetical protein QOE80_1132 [Actinomycetota bacterium]|nr:hypothetical protein [Actinomycetota bacterium]
MAPPAGPARRLKLLLDVHHSHLIAEALSQGGHDLVAASLDPALADLGDDELLRAATCDGRAVVTENARDFDRIVRAWPATGEHHAGVIVTSPRRYHRGSRSYPANLTAALRALLTSPPQNPADWVHWV